jgi:uncharacterized protein
MREMLDGGERTPEHCAAVKRHEQDADDVASKVMEAVSRVFITPFDRSDIRELIGLMDDAVDQMHKTAKAVTLFEVRTFQPEMVQLGDVVVRAADLTAQAMPLLRSLKSNAAELRRIAAEIAELEEQSDQLYDAGMVDLYRGPARQDPMAFIVGGEVYDHLEKVVDRLEDVAKRISGLLIEHL